MSSACLRNIIHSDQAVLASWLQSVEADGWSLLARDGWSARDLIAHGISSEKGCDNKGEVERANRHNCFVLEWQKSARGVCLSQAILDEASLLYIATDKSYRRKGFATLLLTHLFKLCEQRGVKRLFLDVRASNIAAIAFYQNLGFAASGIRRNYYAERRQTFDHKDMVLPAEDALQMSYAF